MPFLILMLAGCTFAMRRKGLQFPYLLLGAATGLALIGVVDLHPAIAGINAGVANSWHQIRHATG